MLRWLTRLFRQREAVETASQASPASSIPPAAASAPTVRDAGANGDKSTTEGVAVAAVIEPEKETCPTCGRTSVFAGPPGQRFCTYCALRGELFEPSAAASD
ncbi:MAG TPA: hypothetical protein VIT43_11130 [Candidatus Dormibacteraeota bacterium]